MVEIHKPRIDFQPSGERKQRSFADGGGAWVKGPKAVNHPHQVGLRELLSMASTRLRGEVGGRIGLTRDGAAVWRPQPARARQASSDHAPGPRSANVRKPPAMAMFFWKCIV